MGLLKQLRPVLIPAIVLIAGASLLAWLLLAEPPAPPSAQKVASADTGHEASSPPPTRKTAAPQADSQSETTGSHIPLPSEIRDVSPEGISPPDVTGRLTRIRPSQRLLDLINPPVEPVPDGEFELRRPQVIDAGTLGTEDLVVRIAHVNALKADETCVSRVGGTWPCGARARTALRGLVRMFTVVCQKTEDLGPRQIAATCTRRKIDIGEWLVRYGWAAPAATAPEPYAALAQEAKKHKRGKWQAEWLKDLPEPAADLSLPDLPSGLPGDLPDDGSNILVSPQDPPSTGPGLRETLPPNG
ncbi:thermonuclease family protein [Roseibium aggregatum]|uniref:Thermonuclease family protein n=1 Tax=Roseibium aggregatum TaxID=187304 RepID=A0A926P167_9HYPH|nr:thermonuclease family protein [Roseibium aggregatum]MBD1547078.1 thermonuclease family protein [Roseibium aggregatum]